MYCIRTAEDIVKLLSPSGSAINVVFLTPTDVTQLEERGEEKVGGEERSRNGRGKREEVSEGGKENGGKERDLPDQCEIASYVHSIPNL